MNSKTFGIPCSWPLRSLWCIPDSGQETPAFVRPSPCSNGPKMGMRAPKLTWRDNSHASSKSFGWDLWSGKRISHAAWEAVSLWLVQNGERTQHFLAFPTILSSPSAESMPTSGSAESTGQGNLVCCFPGTLEIKTHYQKISVACLHQAKWSFPDPFSILSNKQQYPVHLICGPISLSIW